MANGASTSFLAGGMWRALAADDRGPYTDPYPRRRIARAMTLRSSFLPLRPDLDEFLFATVGDETDGLPLSVISALTRLGLDPWQEAGRLSSLSRREAVEQLARLIAELPGGSSQRDEARKIAGGLIGLLPTRDANRPASPIQIRPRFRLPKLPNSSQLWVVCLVLAAAVLMSAIVHGGLPFGIGSP